MIFIVFSVLVYIFIKVSVIFSLIPVRHMVGIFCQFQMDFSVQSWLTYIICFYPSF